MKFYVFTEQICYVFRTVEDACPYQYARNYAQKQSLIFLVNGMKKYITA